MAQVSILSVILLVRFCGQFGGKTRILGAGIEKRQRNSREEHIWSVQIHSTRVARPGETDP